jgi:hypothetical protein
MRAVDYRRGGRAAPLWEGRVQKMAALVEPGSRVIDLGAGARTLRTYLPEGCSYTGADLTGDLPLDFDAGIYPEGRWDVAVLSGALEYARRPSDVLRALRSMAPVVLVSYAHGGSLDYRTKNGWFNHLSKAGLQQIFRRTGWRHSHAGYWGAHSIYRLERLK